MHVIHPAERAVPAVAGPDTSRADLRKRVTAMQLRGLLLVGTYQGTKPVAKRDGSLVPGMHKLQLDVSTTDRPMIRDAAFFEDDLDTGEPTTIARLLSEGEPKLGDVVAVKVRSGTQQGSGFVNLTALAFHVIES